MSYQETPSHRAVRLSRMTPRQRAREVEFNDPEILRGGRKDKVNHVRFEPLFEKRQRTLKEIQRARITQHGPLFPWQEKKIKEQALAVRNNHLPGGQNYDPKSPRLPWKKERQFRKNAEIARRKKNSNRGVDLIAAAIVAGGTAALARNPATRKFISKQSKNLPINISRFIAKAPMKGVPVVTEFVDVATKETSKRLALTAGKVTENTGHGIINRLRAQAIKIRQEQGSLDLLAIKYLKKADNNIQRRMGRTEAQIEQLNKAFWDKISHKRFARAMAQDNEVMTNPQFFKSGTFTSNTSREAMLPMGDDYGAFIEDITGMGKQRRHRFRGPEIIERGIADAVIHQDANRNVLRIIFKKLKEGRILTPKELSAMRKAQELFSPEELIFIAERAT